MLGGHALVRGENGLTREKIRPVGQVAANSRLGNRNLWTRVGVETTSVNDSSSSPGTSFVLILLAVGGCLWLVQHLLTDPPAPVPAPPLEQPTSTSSAAVDFSQATGKALNNSMNDQFKSVQQMVGGEFDGKTYVPPRRRK